MLTKGGGGVKKVQKYADVICEWPLTFNLIFIAEEDKEKSCDVASDVAALEEVLRMVLEIINSTLISQNKSNANFIYTLLYHQHIFEHFHNHPSFQDLLQNIETVSII